MAENSHIEWTDHTFNPWIGCTKVSPGCANCYAESLAYRREWAEWGKGKPRKRTAKSTWMQPFKWDRDSAIQKKNDFGPFRERNPRVFCASLADWLDDEVPVDWLSDLLKLIHETPNLNWLLLTKRLDNWRERMLLANRDDCFIPSEWLDGRAPDNVWLGTSVEDQKRADERIPLLMSIPAKVRFLSIEPLLERIDLGCVCWFSLNSGPNFECEKCGKKRLMVDWAIVGGESGPSRRDCGVTAIQDVIVHCASVGVPLFVKQDCAARAGQQGRILDDYWNRKAFPK